MARPESDGLACFTWEYSPGGPKWIQCVKMESLPLALKSGRNPVILCWRPLNLRAALNHNHLNHNQRTTMSTTDYIPPPLIITNTASPASASSSS